MTNLSILGHAFSVHFAIALFVVSAIAYAVSGVSNKYVVAYQSRLIARWGLWSAAIMMLITMVFALFAYSASTHDDLSHGLLNEHRLVALFVGFMILILAICSLILLRGDKEEGLIFILLSVVAAVALLYVTWTGTLLVFQHGVGVSHLPDAQTHQHRTF